MRHARLTKIAPWVVVFTLASTGALIASRKANCDAVGCSFVNYGHPTYASGCFAGGSEGCYNCEYSYNWGYATRGAGNLLRVTPKSVMTTTSVRLEV